jgi:elongation factor G
MLNNLEVRGQYGHCYLKISPNERGEGFEFINSIKGGSIPSEYIPAIEKGVKRGLMAGVVAGYPVVDLIVEVYDGSITKLTLLKLHLKLLRLWHLKMVVEEQILFCLNRNVC